MKLRSSKRKLPTATVANSTNTNKQQTKKQKIKKQSPNMINKQRMLNNGLIQNPQSSKTSRLALCQEIAQRLIGVQAQELTASLISLWQRLPNGASAWDDNSVVASDAPTFTSLRNKLLTPNSGLIRIWGQRGTLHLYDSNDWPNIVVLFGKKGMLSRQKACSNGRIITGKNCAEQLQKACDHVEQVFAESENNRITRASLCEAGFDGNLRYTVFMCSGYSGVGARIDLSSRESVLAPRKFVAPSLKWELPESLQALSSLAVRYFAAYGPAGEVDFRYHFQLPAVSSKPVLKELLSSGVLDEVDSDTINPQFIISKKESSNERNTRYPVRLLGRFDPLLLAHQDKSCWIEPKLKHHIWTRNGMIKASVLVNGRIIGVWSHNLNEKCALTITIQIFGGSHKINESIRSAINQQALGLASFFEADLQEIVYDDN